MRMRHVIYVAFLAGLFLVWRAGHAATDRPHSILPIPQLRNAPIQQPHPDLVVRMLTVREKGRCEPGHTVITFEVVVANAGKSSFAPPPDPPMTVKVLDQHNPLWAGRADLKGPIPPGGSVSVTVQVPYFQGDPGHMSARTVHPFTALVTRGGTVDTPLSKDTNGQPVAGVSLWENCPVRNP